MTRATVADLAADLLAAVKARARLSLATLAERYRDDFLGFCALLEIVPKSGTRAPFVPNAVQRYYLARKTPRDVVLKGRQVGLTTLEQARDVWFFLTRPGARVLVICQSVTGDGPRNQIARNFDTFFDSLRKSGLTLEFSKESSTEWALKGTDATLKIEVAGASQASASKKGRGYTATRLHVTELAFFEYGEETLNAIIETVPNESLGSEIVFESTPNGAAGKFYNDCMAAKAGTSGYAFHFLPWFLHVEEYRAELDAGEMIEPRTDRERYLVARDVSPQQIKWYRRKVAEKGQDRTDQEYPSDPATCFLVSGRLFFERTKIEENLSLSIEPIEVLDRGALRVWQKERKDVGYVIGADTSEGIGGDAAAALVFERGTGVHVATLWGQFRPWDLARALAALGKRFNYATLAVERNNHGHAVLRALEIEQGYKQVFRDRDERPGWLTGEITRTAALDALYDAHRDGQFKTHDRELGAEMLRFVVRDNGKAAAAKGAHDDLVIAAAIGWDVLRKPVPRAPYRNFGLPGDDDSDDE